MSCEIKSGSRTERCFIAGFVVFWLFGLPLVFVVLFKLFNYVYLPYLNWLGTL
jgi:hypothetical protein